MKNSARCQYSRAELNRRLIGNFSDNFYQTMGKIIFVKPNNKKQRNWINSPLKLTTFGAKYLVKKWFNNLLFLSIFSLLYLHMI